MTAGLRKLTLVTHITVSVGWIGAVVAYVTLVMAAKLSPDPQILRAAWVAMAMIGWYAIVPLAGAALLSGIAMALGTPWGLFRHYWVLISFVLTCVAAGVLFLHMPTVSAFARLAADSSAADTDSLRAALNGELLHAGVGLLVLLLVEALNVYKPRGLTAFGRRALELSVDPAVTAPASKPVPGTAAVTPLWVRVVAGHAIVVVALLILAHLTNGGLSRH